MYGDVKWSIRWVDGANGPDNEWGLFPYGDVDLVLMGFSPNRARYQGMRRLYVDTMRRTEIPPSSPPILLTVVPDGAVTGDAEIAWFEGMGNGEWGMVHHRGTVEPWNQQLAWDGHPTVSSDSSVVVFASDRPGSIGGTDLWYSYRQNDRWSEPQLVSGPVNTPCDEISPRFAGDSVIVFASAGHATVGGYDLFSARIIRNGTDLRLDTPKNLGTPVNTPYDELFPIWVDSQTLYYASDQPKRKGADRKDFDLYVLTSRTLYDPVKPAPLKPIPVDRATVTGRVVNNETQKPVADADVTARDAESRDVVASTRTDTAGVYNLSIPVNTPVDVTAQAPDLFYDDVRLVIPDSAANDTIRLEEPLKLPITYVLRVNFPTAIYDDPYRHTLDSNGRETTQSWTEALDLLARNVELSKARLKRLVLIGHTDDVDTDESNMILGRNRVNFIMDELVARGIDRGLMEGRSAGETLLPERRPGESIDLWRKRARRVELVKVLQE